MLVRHHVNTFVLLDNQSNQTYLQLLRERSLPAAKLCHLQLRTTSSSGASWITSCQCCHLPSPPPPLACSACPAAHSCAGSGPTWQPRLCGPLQTAAERPTPALQQNQGLQLCSPQALPSPGRRSAANEWSAAAAAAGGKSFEVSIIAVVPGVAEVASRPHFSRPATSVSWQHQWKLKAQPQQQRTPPGGCCCCFLLTSMQAQLKLSFHSNVCTCWTAASIPSSLLCTGSCLGPQSSCAAYMHAARTPAGPAGPRCA